MAWLTYNVFLFKTRPISIKFIFPRSLNKNNVKIYVKSYLVTSVDIRAKNLVTLHKIHYKNIKVESPTDV